MVARANRVRDDGRFEEAALLFEEALKLRPRHSGWRVQAGHMRKEAGDLEAAEQHYLLALQARPKNAELALQLGHFYKTAGDLALAETHYRRALSLRPGWDSPLNELLGLKRSGWRGRQTVAASEAPRGLEYIHPTLKEELAQFADDAETLSRAAALDRLVPKLIPARPNDLLHEHAETIDVRRLGRMESGFWGIRRTLRGVQAVRGFGIAKVPIVEIEILLNGTRIHRGPPEGAYDLQFERDRDRVKKYPFNFWIDFTPFSHGLHACEVRLIDAAADTRSFHDHVVIAAPLKEEDYPRSDGIVEIDPADPRSVDQQIRERPSMIRDARRVTFPAGVRNILAMRTDQLGDLVASIPALRRLRELCPDARVVGLLTTANADLARTLGLFDEVLIADFPDDPVQRRRVMTLGAQEALGRQLAAYQFDIAIDLAHSNVSRDLLPLSGAKFLYGHGGGNWPWLTGAFEFDTRDRHSAMDTTPHSTKVLALVESLGTILKAHAPIVRRDDLSVDLLRPFGLAPGDRFIVLHTGARLKFSHWPHFTELALMLLEASDLHIVMMSDNPGLRETLPDALSGSARFQLLDQRLSFDQFDAFMSFATVVVGNDSGPKHLAALRGTNVVTLFTARINWTEWGQEEIGKIISRRVPCQGCAIFHDPEECGKGFSCIRDIRPQEVFKTVMDYV